MFDVYADVYAQGGINMNIDMDDGDDTQDTQNAAGTSNAGDDDTMIEFDYGFDEEHFQAWRCTSGGVPEMAVRMVVPDDSLPTDSMEAVFADGSICSVPALTVEDFMSHQGQKKTHIAKKPAANVEKQNPMANAEKQGPMAKVEKQGPMANVEKQGLMAKTRLLVNCKNTDFGNIKVNQMSQRGKEMLVLKKDDKQLLQVVLHGRTSTEQDRSDTHFRQPCK